MTTALTVLYDADCPLCTRFRDWLAAQTLLVPLDLVATVASVDPDDPQDTRRIRGQVAIASTPGRVRDISVSPADPPVPGAGLLSCGPGGVLR